MMKVNEAYDVVMHRALSRQRNSDFKLTSYLASLGSACSKPRFKLSAQLVTMGVFEYGHGSSRRVMLSLARTPATLQPVFEFSSVLVLLAESVR